MRTRRLVTGMMVSLSLAGCSGNGSPFHSLFDRETGPDPSKLPPASTRAATRVTAVGTEIVAQNKGSLPVQPVFFTMGVKEVEISHNKSGVVILSEGLVERCPTDTELAAVICHELGKLAAENATARGGELDPGGPRIGRDVVGGTYEPDMTRMAEEAKYGRQPAAPDPKQPRPAAGRPDAW